MQSDWAGKVSPFVWLGLMAAALIGVSIVVRNDAYVDLWLLTFMYAVVGYALDVGFRRDRHPRLRCIVLSCSVVIYVTLFIFMRFIMLAEPSFPMMD